MNTTTPSPPSLHPGDAERTDKIILASVLIVLYCAVAATTLARANALRRGRHTAGVLLQCNFYFFISVTAHCFFRSLALAGSVYVPSLWDGTAGGAIQTFVLVIPSITFQTTLFIYLRVWQLQCETLDASLPAMPLRLTYVAAWISFWVASFAFDLTMFLTRVTHTTYASGILNVVNYFVLVIGFGRIGDVLHGAIVRALYASTAYENHVLRVTWIFGLSCLSRSVFGVVELVNVNIVPSSLVFMPVYYSLLELIPLSAAIASIFRARNKSLIQQAPTSQKYSESAGEDVQ